MCFKVSIIVVVAFYWHITSLVRLTSQLYIFNSLAYGSCIYKLNWYFSNWYQGYVECVPWNCPRVYAAKTHWWLVNIGSGNCLAPLSSHYLSQYWSRSMSSYGVTRPQWVNLLTVIWMDARVPVSASVARAVCPIDTMRPRQNGRHFPDDIFRCMFLIKM